LGQLEENLIWCGFNLVQSKKFKFVAD